MIQHALKVFRDPVRAWDVLRYRAHYVGYHVVLRQYSTVGFRVRSYLAGVTVGKCPSVWGTCRIVRFPGSSVEIGDHFHCVSNVVRSTASTVAITRIKTYSESAAVVLGDRVGLNGTSITCRSTRIEIGDGTKFGPGCVAVDSDFHNLEPERRQLPSEGRDRPVTIGRNVWIGMRCIILKGVTIGDSSIVGAGSVVTKDIGANEVWVGNPATYMRDVS